MGKSKGNAGRQRAGYIADREVRNEELKKVLGGPASQNKYGARIKQTVRRLGASPAYSLPRSGPRSSR